MRNFIFRPIICFMFVLVLITGCATTEPTSTLRTPTGKADILIPNASKAEIADKITSSMLSSDFLLEGRDADINALSFVRHHSETWFFRYTYNLVNHPPEGVRVVTNISRIKNPGSADRTVTDLSRNSKEAESAYILLTTIRDSFSHRKATHIAPRKGLGMSVKDYIITSVAEGGAAKNAGLQEGDKILKVDGEPMTGDQMKDAVRINGKPGAITKFLIKRSDKELVIDLAR